MPHELSLLDRLPVVTFSNICWTDCPFVDIFQDRLQCDFPIHLVGQAVLVTWYYVCWTLGQGVHRYSDRL